MKKLTMAVAAVALTVTANAATVNWMTDYEIGKGTEGSVTAATMVYLIDAATLTQSSIYNSVNGGKSLADTIGENSVASATLSNGLISKQTLTIDATGSKTYYMALFDSTVGDKGALYFSDQQTWTLSSVGSRNYAFTSDSSINAVAADMTGFNASSGGWVAVGGTSPVPEPTSGLLLVLGMAGLLLRRRRA